MDGYSHEWMCMIDIQIMDYGYSDGRLDRYILRLVDG